MDRPAAEQVASRPHAERRSAPRRRHRASRRPAGPTAPVSRFSRRDRAATPAPAAAPSPDTAAGAAGSGPPAEPAHEPEPWPQFGPPHHLGQLEDGFQAALGRERTPSSRASCAFYHTTDLGEEGVVEGPWDLRGREDAYLGHVDFAGKRVLELGPSTGHLTFFMEGRGAEVVCLDAGWDVSIDLLPAPGGETRRLRQDHARMVTSFQSSWWYTHRVRRSAAKMVYGDIYALPGDLGTFDVAVFGAILLHLRSPITALEEAARRTREAIVVTEPWPGDEADLHGNHVRIFPNGEAGRWVIWWEHSAGAISAMLEMLGFGDTTVVVHRQRHQHGHLPGAPYTEQLMYTVVGRRR